MDLIDREKLMELLESEINACESIMVRPSFWTALSFIKDAPTVEAKEVVHGEWMLEVEKEPNCHWSVKAQCSNCSYEKGEIWGGNFPDVPAYLALELSLIYAKEVKMSNFCPDCGADMRSSAK